MRTVSNRPGFSATPRFVYQKYLIIVGTTTPEKIMQLNAAARGANIPVYYVSLKSVTDAFPSADENSGRSFLNALLKFQAINYIVDNFTTSPTTQKVLRDVWHDVIGSKEAFNTKNVFFMTEDSTFLIPKPIWEIMRTKLEPFVPEEILSRAEKNKFKTGPGAETGPIMGAVGISNFFNTFLQATYEVNFTDALKQAVQNEIKKSKGTEKAGLLATLKAPAIKACLSHLAKESFKSQSPTALLRAARGTFRAHACEGLSALIRGIGVQKCLDLIGQADLDMRSHNRFIPIVDRSVGLLRCLNDPSSTTPSKEITVEAHLCLARTDLKKPFKPAPDGVIEVTRHFMAERRDPSTPLADVWEDFLPTESVRAKMTREIYRYASGNELHPPKTVAKVFPRLVAVSPSFKNFDIATVDPSSLKRHRDSVDERAGLCGSRLISALDISDLVHQGDGTLFAPLTDLSWQDRRLATFSFFSVRVARSLVSSEMEKPTIVLNDGSWTPVLKMMPYLINSGMSKGFEESACFGTVPLHLRANVDYRCLCGIDILTSPDPKELQKAASEILSFRKMRYHRYQSPGDLNSAIRFGGWFPREKGYTVFPCTSASSDNKIALNMDRDYGAFLAREGYYFAWGSGDRHGMGESFTGYKDENGLWSIGSSTPVIVTSETDKGAMPPSDAWALCPNIYQRMGLLLEAADQMTFGSGGGGDGTIQEGLAFPVARDMCPEEMANKQLLIHAPDLRPIPGQERHYHLDPALNLMMPQEEAEALRANHRAFANQGIRLSTTPEEMKTMTKEAANEWAKNPVVSHYLDQRLVSLHEAQKKAPACYCG